MKLQCAYILVSTEICLNHRCYLFRSLGPVLRGGGGGNFRYRHLHSSFLQFSEFCHALGVKIALILLLRHFDNETIRVSNSERNGKYINQRENKLEIAAPSSQFVQIQYVGENGCPNLFSTKVIKSHVKLHVKSDA